MKRRAAERLYIRGRGIELSYTAATKFGWCLSPKHLPVGHSTCEWLLHYTLPVAGFEVLRQVMADLWSKVSHQVQSDHCKK